MMSAAHRVAGEDVLGDRGLEEALRGIDLDVARSDVGLVDHAPDTAEMVGVAVGVDHGLDRLLAAVLEIEVDRDLGRLRREQRIDDHDSLVALDDGHVRQVLIADLVDAVGDLEQTADVDQLRLAPEAGIDGFRRRGVLGDEAILLRVPDRVARLALDHLAWQRRDEAPLRALEIGAVGER
jgi:hypothetical protein